jgi:glutathione S-transferase
LFERHLVLRVYLDPCTVNSRKVLAGLNLLGTEYKLNHVNHFTGEHKSEEYKKINPHATVPSAVDDGPTITESNAIFMYAADRDGVDSAYPKDLKQRAEVNRWLLWESCAWFPSCYKYLMAYIVKPLLQAEPDQKVIDKEAPNWNKLAKLLNDQLAKPKWLVGEQPAIADIAIATPMHLWEVQRLPLDQYPNLKRWMTEGVEKLPCWQKTQGAVDKAMLPNKVQSAGAAKGTVNGQSEVRSTLNYTKDLSPKLTELYFYESGAARSIHEPGDDPHEVSFFDG